MNPEIIERIIQRIRTDSGRYPTRARHAHYLGMTVSAYSNVTEGRWENQLDEARWRNIAHLMGVDWTEDTDWEVVKTPTFDYVTAQLEACRQGGISAILVDVPNIGKSVAARYYARHTPSVAYVDCSLFKTRDRMLREICRQFGIPDSGSYHGVLDRLVFNINAMDRPLVIADEAGDLSYDAFLELKALWNATEHHCGWYMIGADGLRKKIERRITAKRVGYTELFSRYGDDFRRVTPLAEDERKKFLVHQTRMIARANARPGQDPDRLARQSGGSARRVRDLIRKPVIIEHGTERP